MKKSLLILLIASTHCTRLTHNIKPNISQSKIQYSPSPETDSNYFALIYYIELEIWQLCYACNFFIGVDESADLEPTEDSEVFWDLLRRTHLTYSTSLYMEVKGTVTKIEGEPDRMHIEEIHKSLVIPNDKAEIFAANLCNVYYGRPLISVKN